MTQQVINTGSAPNDGTGDPDRTAWTKANANFTELYAAIDSPQGRLTLQSGTPVMTTTQAAQTTIYYSPYVGNTLPIYTGTTMTMVTFAELSVATTDTTKSPAAIGASKVNDWFVWNDAGTLRLGHGPDWASDTARTDALVGVSGIWLNNVAITNGPAAQRGTYVGTTRSNASSQLDWIYGAAASGGTAAWLAVWNCYNRVTVATEVRDNGASYTYSSATVRQARASAGNQISFVRGLQEDGVQASFFSQASPAGVLNAACYWSLGLDVTNAHTVPPMRVYTGQAVVVVASGASVATFLPAIGWHFVSANEASDGSNANNFCNQNAQTLSAVLRM